MDRSDRREFLIGSAAWAAGAMGLIGALGDPTQAAAVGGAKPAGSSVMPGPFRGRVVEVAHPGSVVDGRVKASLTTLGGTEPAATLRSLGFVR